jgi:hypothetical protein
VHDLLQAWQADVVALRAWPWGHGDGRQIGVGPEGSQYSFEAQPADAPQACEASQVMFAFST